VTGGTSTHSQVGDVFSATLCINSRNDKATLLAGTVAHL